MVSWEPQPRNEKAVFEIAKRFDEADEWLIVTHERPDGDAIGSALAVAHILSFLAKKWVFMVSEPLPRRFSYLPLFDKAVVMDASHQGQFRHVIAVDCADIMRFQPVRDALAENPVILNIDHHRTNPMYGIANLVDEHAAATCELLYHVAQALHVALGDGLAKSLYTGILTDTGGFAQPNTSREVHRIAAELLACGVQPYDIAEPALESRTWEQMHLLQMGLANLTVSSDRNYAAIYVTRGMLEGAGADDDDVEGLVSFARSIDTVEVGLLFRETKDGKVKVSMRSKRYIDVAKIAMKFGGGGHVRAAGCTLSMDLGDAMDVVAAQVEQALAEVQRR